jgi:hypothetical protein
MSQLRQLAEPFPESLIERKPGQGGGDYVTHSTVIEKALSIVGAYSISHVELIRGYAPEVVTSPNDEKKRKVYPAQDNVVVGALVTITCEVDGRMVSITEAGDVENPLMKATDGARAKDAISDAVKRCWMRLGLGLHLWSQENYVLHKVLERNEKAKEPRQGEAVTPNAGQVPEIASRQAERAAEERDGPPPLTDAAAAHAELQHPESLAEQGKPHEPRKLTSKEAAACHAKLGAIGWDSAHHLAMAEHRFGREFTSFTELTIQERVELQGYAERQMEKRKAAQGSYMGVPPGPKGT